MSLVSQSFKWLQNPDGTLDGAFPNGDKVPSSELVWDNSLLTSTLDVIGIDAIETGTPFSHNVRQYLSGTDAGSATLSLVNVSGDNPTTNGWTAPGSGDSISYDAVNERSGVFRIRATGSTGDVDSASIAWSCTAAIEELSWNNNNLTNSLSAAGINIMTTGTPFSHNVRQYLNGTEADTATITFVNVSGDNPTTNGWTAPGSGNNIAYDGVNARSGVFQLRATGTSGAVDSISVSWSCTVAEIELSWNNTTMTTNLISAGIQVMQTGTPFSHNVRQYLSGTDASIATLSFVNVSGDNPTTNGWTAPGSGNNIAYNAVNARSGSFRLRATSSPEVVDSSVINWACTSGPPPPGPADFTYSANGSNRIIDGDAIGAGPGDIIEFAAGTHGTIKFRNLIGQPNNRIRIRNGSGGQAIFRSSSLLTGGFMSEFENCQYVDFIGDNSNSAPLHPFSGARIGFKFMYSQAARLPGTNGPSDNGAKDNFTALVKFQATSNRWDKFVHNIKMSHFEIDGGWDPDPDESYMIDGGGIALHANDSGIKRNVTPNQGQWHEGLTLEHFVFKRVAGEGVYLGSNWGQTSLPLRNINVSYGMCDTIGRDGINPKSWWEGNNSIHHMIVKRCAISQNVPDAPSGLSLISSPAKVYNCIVYSCGPAGAANSGNGIVFRVDDGPDANTSPGTGYTTTYSQFEAEIYNCVVAHNFGNGINCGTNTSLGWQMKIYNCAAYSNGGSGIATGSGTRPGSFIRNCISLGNTGQNISPGSNTTQRDNLSTGTATSIWVNPTSTTNPDFHLLGNQPVGSQSVPGVDVPLFDLDDSPRSSGTAADKGPYDYP